MSQTGRKWEDAPLDENETFSDKLVKKTKSNPFLITGVLGFCTVVGVGLYKFKYRKITTQMYLIQLRVIAQSAAVGCLTVGMLYHMVQKHVYGIDEHKMKREERERQISR